MSSILRALKKLDEDVASRDGQTGGQEVKIKQVVHRRAHSPRFTYRIISIILAILLLSTVGWIMTRSAPKPPAPTPTPEQQPLPEPAKQQKQTPVVKPEIKQPQQSKPTPPPPETVFHTSPPQPVQRPDLTLGGILWSGVPERRQALINDRYLKEGDTIQGVTLIKIEKKSVTLQSGQDTWTLSI